MFVCLLLLRLSFLSGVLRAGFECDWSRYPTKEMQFNFFRAYLRVYSPSLHVTDSVLEAMYREVNSYGLVAHLNWGIWSLVMAQLSTIDLTIWRMRSSVLTSTGCAGTLCSR